MIKTNGKYAWRNKSFTEKVTLKLSLKKSQTKWTVFERVNSMFKHKS